MKKILAIILSILMIVTTIPFAFAAEDTKAVYVACDWGTTSNGIAFNIVFKDADENEVSLIECNTISEGLLYEYIVPESATKLAFLDGGGIGGGFLTDESFITIPSDADTYHFNDEVWYCSHQMGASIVENGAAYDCEICGEKFRVIYVNWYIRVHLGDYEMKFFDSTGNELACRSEPIEDNFDYFIVPADVASYYFEHTNGVTDEGAVPENVDYYDAESKTWYCSHNMETSGKQTCKGFLCEICGKTYGEADPNAHDWSNLDGICANGCGSECDHAGQIGTCKICGMTDPDAPLTIDVTDKDKIYIGEGYDYYDKDGYIIVGTNKDITIDVYESCDITLSNVTFGDLDLRNEDNNVKVTLEGDNYCGYADRGVPGITVYKSHLTIEGGEDDTLTFKGSGSLVNSASYAGSFTVNGGKIIGVTETTHNYPTIFCDTFIINGGEVTASNNFCDVLYSETTLNGGVLNIVSTSQDDAAINQTITIKKGALLTVSAESGILYYDETIVPADDADENESLFVRYDKTSNFVPVYNIKAALKDKTYAEIRVDTHEHSLDNSGSCDECDYVCRHEGIEDGKCDICERFFYKIMHQPTEEEPWVELNDDTDASYQWYYGEKGYTELTDEEALAVTQYGNETSYSEEEGWTGYRDTYYGDVGYFMVGLKKGETLEIELSEAVTDGFLYIQEKDEYSAYDYEYFTGTKVELTAPADGTYELYSEEIDESVKLRVNKNGYVCKTAVEGESSAELSSPVIGKTYACKVTCGDGETVLTSDFIEFSYAITHQPTTEELWVDLNDATDASYQWCTCEIATEEITDKNASGDWQSIDATFGNAVYEDGKWFAAEEDGAQRFFFVDLEAGDTVNFEFSSVAYDVLFGSENSFNGPIGVYDTKYSVTVEESDTYYLVVLGEPVDYVSATLERYEYTLIEGETSAELQNPAIGNTYACKVTCGDGETVLTSDPVKIVYAITHQPTEEEPWVELNDATNASYQWYAFEEGASEITDQNASGDWQSQAAPFGNTVYEDGKWIANTWNGYQFYFMVDLEAGDTVNLEFASEVKDIVFGIDGDPYNATFEINDTKYSITVEESGTYWLVVLGEPVDYVRATVEGLIWIPVEGATSAELENTEYGNKYACKVTFADGSIENSDVVDFSYKITHQPTAQEPWVELNDDTDASYQWYAFEEGTSEITDQNASGDWQSLGAPFENTVYEDGKWIADICEDLQYYFMVDLEAGDTVNFEFASEVEAIEFVIDGDYNEDAVFEVNDTKYSITVEESGTYWLVVSGTPVDYVRATVEGLNWIPVEGATSAELTPAEDGEYSCKVTCGDGETVLTSDAFTATHICSFTGEWKYDSEKHWKECECGETEEVAHSYIDGVCECGTMGITNIEDFGCFPDDGWYTEEGIPEEISPNVEGKIEWVNGDEITITMNSETYGTQTAVMTYQDGSWVGDIALAYDENEDLDYLLTVAYGKVDGTEEYLLAGHIIDGSTLKISFEYSDRVYSRLRLVGDANESYEISVTEFMPAGSGNLDSYNYTLTADDNGNAFLYGYFAEGSILTINGVDCTLNYLNGTISGKSYAICAVHSGTEATCKGVLCENCGLYFGEKDLSKHTLVQVEAKAPTCTEAGYDAYEYCTDCDYTTKVEIPVNPDAHAYNNGVCGCGYECPHKETYYDIIRPVQNADGTWGKGTAQLICVVCGPLTPVEEVERNHEGYKLFDETAAKLELLLGRDDIIPTPKESMSNSLRGNRNAAYSRVYTDLDFEKEMLASMTKNVNDMLVELEARIADGMYIKADFSYLVSLLNEINALVDNNPENIISSFSVIYADAVNFYKNNSNNPGYNQNAYDYYVNSSDLENQLEKLIAGLKDGSALKGDYTAIDEAIAEIEQKLADENVTDEAKAGLEEIKSQLEEKKADGNTSAADLAELEKTLEDYEEELDAGIEDGTAVKADYTAIDEAIAEIEKKLADENVTDEAKAELEEIKSQLEEKKADGNTSAADLAELEKALEDYEEELDAGIEDGTLVEVDGIEILLEYQEEMRSALIKKYGYYAYEEIVTSTTAEVEAEARAIEEAASALTGTVAENAEKIAEIKAKFKALFDKAELCLAGTHSYTYEEFSSAQCGKNAVEEGTCWFCGKTVTREVENSALKHSFTKYEVVDAPTCNKAGKEVAACDNDCGATDEKEIPATDHKGTLVQVKGKAETCTEAGYGAYEYCTACNYTTYKEIPATNHKGTLVQVKGKAATCAEAGYGDYEYCTACDYSSYKEIPATNHKDTLVQVKAKDATCTEAGYGAYEYCTACNYTTYKEIEALGHSFLEYIYNEDATCDADGTKTAECINGCGKTDTVTEKGTRLDHTDADGDKVCDSCKSEIIVRCERCGNAEHNQTGISLYICLIVSFFRFVINAFKSII